MNLTKKQIQTIKDNVCVNCGNITNENLRKWFKDKWVNIGKKRKDGSHPPCGTSGKKRGYAKCVPASKARSMSKKEKQSATRRKRAAQNKAGRGGTSDLRGGGKKPIRVKTKAENVMKFCQHNECAEQAEHIYEKKDACYHKVKARYDVWPSAYASGALVKCRKVGAKNWGNKSKKEYMDTMAKKRKRKGLAPVKESFGCLCEKCWKGYEKKGTKKMFGKTYPNCVKKEGIKTDVWIGENEIYWENNIGESCGYTFEFEDQPMNEAEYQGRKVKLGKIMQGDTKKFKVYVKNPKGNVVKVNFGHGGSSVKGKSMRIRKSNPEARKSFRARHNCDNPGPRHKARYWSCRKW